MPKKAEKFFVTTLQVQGSGEYPWDMLRYDMCGPKTEGENLRAHKGLAVVVVDYGVVKIFPAGMTK